MSEEADLAHLERCRQARRAFYARYPEFWADINGREYALYQVHSLTLQEAAAIRQAAANLWRIYTRVAALLRELPDDTLLQLGLPGSTLPVSRLTLPDMPGTVIGRLDMVRTPEGYKMLEFNADTPTFLYESFHLNGAICKEFGCEDVNAGERLLLQAALQAAVRASLRGIGKSLEEPALVAFASYADHTEDRGTTRYLLDLTPLPAPMQTCYVGIEHLRIDAQGLYTPDGERIDVLYRLYPLEFFAQDRDPKTGAEIGAMLFDLVRRGRLALINPPSAFLLQSKGVQAVIWGLYEANQYFTEEERSLIAAHLLPTYLDPLSDQEKYVAKPMYGREGDTISLLDPSAGWSYESQAHTFIEQPRVYQKYAPIPQAELMTEAGPQRLSLLTSCFLVGGRPCGIGMRAGGLITDLTAYFLPVALDLQK